MQKTTSEVVEIAETKDLTQLAAVCTSSILTALATAVSIASIPYRENRMLCWG